jgi:hypothetical protein
MQYYTNSIFACHLRFLIITFGFFKKLTYVVFYDDNLLIHVNFTHLNTILTVTEYILVTKYDKTL